MTSILIFALLTILSALGVWIIRQYAERRRIMDHPNERSLHSAPTPRGGGVAIVIVVLAAGCVAAFHFNLTQSLIYLVCGAVIAYLGWRDDVHSLSPRVRFAVQGLVALASVLGMGYFKSVTIPLFGQLQLGAIGFIVTLLWIVGLTNAYNFMDGIDGIAGGVALSAALGWMFLATRTDNHFVYWVALAVGAGSLGFLFHNWSPAKIFMGDAGSTFLGYTFAVLPLLSASEGGDALMLGTLLMWTFIMDAGVTFIRRALKRENVFAAHRTHLYQRLVSSGYKHATVTLLYIFLTLLAAALAYAWSWGQPYAPPLIIIGLPLLWLILSRYVRKLNTTKDLN
ncbi:MAG: glycosyltransferase family 4 protein [Anaerolineales bacterium]|nr:MAG: glycosyltransferase family 4 protein [Anaerolineales bacterium]